MKPEDIGIISTSEKGDADKQPFMVAFLKSAGGRKVRKTRETRRRKKTEHSEISYNRNPLLGEIQRLIAIRKYCQYFFLIVYYCCLPLSLYYCNFKSNFHYI